MRQKKHVNKEREFDRQCTRGGLSKLDIYRLGVVPFFGLVFGQYAIGVLVLYFSVQRGVYDCSWTRSINVGTDGRADTETDEVKDGL